MEPINKKLEEKLSEERLTFDKNTTKFLTYLASSLASAGVYLLARKYLPEGFENYAKIGTGIPAFFGAIGGLFYLKKMQNSLGEIFEIRRKLK